MPATIGAVHESCPPHSSARSSPSSPAKRQMFRRDPVPCRSPLPNEFMNSLCCSCLLLLPPSKKCWQSRKDIVTLIADVVRIKASAEHFEVQGPACLQAW